MKEFILYSNTIYIAAFLVAYIIMLITDYLLGKEAEHLNAWSVLLHTFNIKTDIPPSKAMVKFGLWGAWGIILLANSFFGFIAVQLLRLVVKNFFIL